MARASIPRRLRFAVFDRDYYRCRYCGRRAPTVVLHIEHVKPVSRGGGNDLANLVTACEDCNFGKGTSVLRAGPPPLPATIFSSYQLRMIELIDERTDETFIDAIEEPPIEDAVNSDCSYEFYEDDYEEEEDIQEEEDYPEQEREDFRELYRQDHPECEYDGYDGY